MYLPTLAREKIGAAEVAIDTTAINHLYTRIEGSDGECVAGCDGNGNIPLNNNVDRVFVTLADAAHGLIAAKCVVVVPSNDLLLTQVGEPDQLTVFSHRPNAAHRRLLKGPLSEHMAISQMCGLGRQIVSRIVVGGELIAQVVDHLAFVLNVERCRSYTERGKIRNTTIALNADGDVRWSKYIGVLPRAGRPHSACGKQQQLVELEHALDLVHLVASDGEGDRIIVLNVQRAGRSEVRVAVRAAHPHRVGC